MRSEDALRRTVQELEYLVGRTLPDAWRQVLRRRRLTDIQARLVLTLLALPHDAEANRNSGA
jgi:hypothetical protein